jgi:hypothetical protein
MSKDNEKHLSSDKKEERGPLSQATSLAPLLTVILQALELLLRLLGVIR